MDTDMTAELNCGHFSGSVSHDSVTGDTVNWQERCQILEVSLLKFKQKAARIRELLDEKMKSTDKEIQDANQRALLAEEKYKQMEAAQSIHNVSSAVPSCHTASQFVVELKMKLEELERKLSQRDVVVASLQCQLTEQIEMRQQEAKIVEEKSAKIRQWISSKLQEMESRNVQLATENEDLRQQMQLLKEPIVNNLPDGNYSDSEFSPPVPKRPSSSIIANFRR